MPIPDDNRFLLECRALSDMVRENRPATAEVFGLVPRVFRVTQVDQVEVDSLDIGPPEVGSLKVSLADLFGRLDSLIVIIIGVEARTAPLAGDRTAHKSATRRPEVK